MADGSSKSKLRILSSIKDVAASEWNACAGSVNPFVGHGFLSALEESDSASGRSGWSPHHLAIEDGQGRLLAGAPLYLKDHSYGEYVFDWGWAEAYERAGGAYYPKLQAAVPFTPVTGPRLLVRDDESPALADRLIGAMVGLAENLGVSSLHVTFPTEPEWRRLGDRGFLRRLAKQFHWENRGYASFDDFLAALSARKRKAIRKERQAVADAGVTIKTLVGSEIAEHHWDSFHRFYLDTISRKWGPAHLSRAFFSLMHQHLGEHVVLVIAEKNGRPVGGALNLMGTDTLYGRNWGCGEAFKFLHFEACYYRAIDFAIARGLKRVEAGAQGPHKLQRGYLPRPTYSAHWIVDPAFRDAVARFLERERREVAHEMRALAEASPFRHDGAG